MNEYFEAFNRHKERHSFTGQQWFGGRKQLVEQYAWAVPNDEVIDYIQQFHDIVEIGAGEGYWASLVSEADNTHVSAYDPSTEKRWFDVQQERLSDISEEIQDSVVLMVWPPVNNKMAWHVVRKQPNHILYVGEPRGGCTAEDTFFDRLYKEYGLVERIDIPSYEGVHDNFFHYIRKV